jgi:hypothetical protein
VACLPPTIFSYTSLAPEYSVVRVPDPVLDGTLRPVPADLNGDGKEDLVYTRAGSWRMRLSNGSTLGQEIDTGLSTTLTNDGWWLVLDWDGDGLEDVLALEPGTSTWRVLRSTGTTFVAADIGLQSFPGVLGFADMNGDGRDDLLRVNTGTFIAPGASVPIYVYFREGAGFSAPVVLGTIPNVAEIWRH